MANETIQLSEILKSCIPGKIQSVGIMQVIPLVSEITNDNFVSPMMAAKVSTSGYGTLVVDNQSKEPMIVPPQTGYVVKQSAQDHALPGVKVVNGKMRSSFNNAMCIQSSQGGLISSEEHKMLVLPFPLRERAHVTRNDFHYDRLWGDISALNRRAGLTGRYTGAHLEYFLNEFKDQLDRFVAEFEPVPNQVGAIILINGRVVGIEKAPNYEYWSSVWSALIRECYGSLAILEARESKKTEVPPTRVPLRKADSVADLKKALQEATDEEYDKVKDIVNNISDIHLGQKVDENVGDLNIEELSHKRFVGQIVRNGDVVVYASLVATKDWRENEDWYESEPFKM